MRSRTGLLALLALAFSIVLFVMTGKRVYENHDAAVTEVTPHSGAVSQTEKKPLLSLRSLLTAPLRGESAMGSGLSQACSRFEESLFNLATGELGDPKKVENLPRPEGCVPANPKIAKMLKYYSLKCDAAAVSKGTGREECSLAAILLRSTLASIARGERPVKEMTDLHELADLLVASFGEFFTDLSPSGVKEMIEVSDRMLELDASLFPAAKAGVMGSMIRNSLAKEAQDKGEVVPESPNWDDLEKRVARIEELNPKDPDLDALHRIVETEGMDPERVKRDSLNRLSKDPSNWREHQILAWANWKLGRRDDASAELRQALHLNPGNPELQANLAAVNRRNAQIDDFKVTLKIGIGLTDLLK